MSYRRNDLFELHPASVVGSLMGGRPATGPAKRDAEPDLEPAKPHALRRLVAAISGRREASARAQAERA